MVHGILKCVRRVTFCLMAVTIACSGGEETIARVKIANLSAFPQTTSLVFTIDEGPRYEAAPKDDSFLLRKIPSDISGQRGLTVQAISPEACVFAMATVQMNLVAGKTIDVTVQLALLPQCLALPGQTDAGMPDTQPGSAVAGASCTTSNQCASGFCVDGLCCESACDGQCEACGAGGVCAAVVGAPKGTRAACAAMDVACGGSCDGQNGARCVYPGIETTCAAASCTQSSAISKAVCNGAGACSKPQPIDCGSNPCKGGQCGECVEGGSDCPGGSYCNTGKCLPQLAAGDTCQSNTSCKSGACTSTGVCCDRACNGPCEACSAAGKCEFITGKVCASAEGPCELASMCSGTSGSCPAKTFHPNTTVCRAADPSLLCQADAKCSGSAAVCPSSPFVAMGTACGTQPQSCEIKAVCSGTAYACPGNQLQGATVVCRASTGSEGRDPTERCTGTKATCPTDVIHPNLLTNGEFETATNFWTTNSRNSTFAVDHVTPLSGTGSMRMTIAQGDFFTVSQTVALPAGTYHVALLMKASRNDTVVAGDGVNVYFVGLDPSWSKYYDLKTTAIVVDDTFTVGTAGNVTFNIQSNTEGFQKAATIWVDRIEIWK